MATPTIPRNADELEEMFSDQAVLTHFKSTDDF